MTCNQCINFLTCITELYTLLHRSQRSRIEDQRGVLDKKIELPDFLKQPKKPDKGNNLQDDGVAKPFHRHPPLIKSTSSPPACEPSDNLPEKFPASSVHVQPSPRDNTMSRNWSGSSIMQGKPHVTQVVNQTQTIDRRRFFKTMQDSSPITRLRAGSLPEDKPGGRYDEFSAASERRARSRYQYGSESSFGNKENQVVWVSNALHKNRRREPNKTDHSGGPGNKTQTGNDWNSNCVKAEVIIPQMKSNTSRFSPPRGVRNGERPKPIRDNSFVREYLQTTEPRTSTPDDQSKAHPLESASDREAILDNSFLRTQLKPSRLFSQTSPETNTPLGSSSPAQKRNQWIEDPKKCPIFYSGDSGQDDTITEPSPESPVKLDSARQVYWGLSELGNEEEAVKVTFV